MKFLCRGLACIVCLLIPTLGSAHPIDAASGLGAGFSHPLLGWGLTQLRRLDETLHAISTRLHGFSGRGMTVGRNGSSAVPAGRVTPRRWPPAPACDR